MGDVTGVVDAIVLPMPVRRVGEITLRLPVVEHGLGDTVVGDDMRAGLCGDPMAMTKGILELDAVLGLRDGNAAAELVDPSRDRKRKGAGIINSLGALCD